MMLSEEHVNSGGRCAQHYFQCETVPGRTQDPRLRRKVLLHPLRPKIKFS